MLQLTLIILSLSIYLTADVTTREYNLTNYGKNTEVNYNIPVGVSDTNTSKWNNTNWADQMSKSRGYDTSIGNTMMFMNGNKFLKKGLTSNPKDMTVKALHDSNETASESGFTESFRNSLVSKVTTNTAYSAKTRTDTLKCFIARDLPFRYKCEETGLTYGGGTIASSADGNTISNMDGMSGKEALNICKTNCKHQLTCVERNATSLADETITNKSFSYEGNETFSTNYTNSNQDTIVDYMTLEINATTTGGLIALSYTNRNGVVFPFLSDLQINSLNTTKQIPINDFIKDINITLYSKDLNNTINGKFINTAIHYRVNSKYICPALQDINANSITSFGKACPHGTVVKFGDDSICSNGTVHGDNIDGSFSNLSTCNNACNIPKKCNIEIGHFDNKIFEEFREGELGNIAANGSFTSANTSAIKGALLCKNARVGGSKILNESAFDAQNVPYNTVVAGTLVPGVKRPRVMANSSLSYELQKREEWKDGAYNTMLKRGRYSMTTDAIGDDTKSHFAYNIDIAGGVNYGALTSTSVRSFIARIKPNALSYNNKISYRIYAIMKVDVVKYRYTMNGHRQVRDQIWYIKTAEGDNFKPFIRAQNYAQSVAANLGAGEILPKLSINHSATYNFETFDNATNSWNPLSSAFNAPSFKLQRFSADDFWYEFKIIDSFGDIVNRLKGIIRSSTITSGGVRTDKYTGKFDGTGDSLVENQIYVFFSQNALTYSDIKNKIDTIDSSGTNQVDNSGAKIYQSTSGNIFNKFIEPDNIDTNNNIDIYQYGSDKNYSLKVRIKPKKEDIGKNAFIFIFMY